MQEVRSICVLCQREQNIPEQDNDSHGLCWPHMRKVHGDELTDKVIAGLAAKKAVLLTSGKQVRTVSPIEAPTGAQIAPGTKAIVLAVQRDADPKIYLVETLENDEFEQEEFWCFADDLEVAV